MNAWLTFSLIFLGIWTVIWIMKPSTRREMMWASYYEHIRWYKIQGDYNV